MNRKTENRRRDDQKTANISKNASRAEQHDQGPDNVELFLDSKRPKMREDPPFHVYGDPEIGALKEIIGPRVPNLGRENRYNREDQVVKQKQAEGAANVEATNECYRRNPP